MKKSFSILDFYDIINFIYFIAGGFADIKASDSNSF